jgi:hypothetical protein
MHERKKYRAEDEKVMNEWDERKMRVAGEEHLVQRSFPISNNKHVALKVGSQNALLQGRSLWKTLLEHTVQDQIEISI